jgi:hypothetical protein
VHFSGSVRHALGEFFHPVEHRERFFTKPLSVLRQSDCFRGPLQKPDSKLFFQPLNGTAYARLRKAKSLSGANEAAGFQYGGENGESSEESRIECHLRMILDHQ